jgi:hypothetical protein
MRSVLTFLKILIYEMDEHLIISENENGNNSNIRDKYKLFIVLLFAFLIISSIGLSAVLFITDPRTLKMGTCSNSFLSTKVSFIPSTSIRVNKGETAILSFYLFCGSGSKNIFTKTINTLKVLKAEENGIQNTFKYHGNGKYSITLSSNKKQEFTLKLDLDNNQISNTARVIFE